MALKWQQITVWAVGLVCMLYCWLVTFNVSEGHCKCSISPPQELAVVEMMRFCEWSLWLSYQAIIFTSRLSWLHMEYGHYKKTRMWANDQRDGRPANAQCHKVWLVPTDWVPCSNAASKKAQEGQTGLCLLTLLTFKTRLDEFRHNQDIIDNFSAQLQGTGSLSTSSYY